MLSGAFPTLESVIAWPVLVVPTICCPNVNEAGEKLTSGLVTFPIRSTDWGLSSALSVTVRLAVRTIPPDGDDVKLTLKVQVDPGAIAAGGVPQVLVCVKSPAFDAAIAIAAIFTG